MIGTRFYRASRRVAALRTRTTTKIQSCPAVQPRWLSAAAAATSDTTSTDGTTTKKKESSELDLSLKPSEVVAGLDAHIVGQHDAKRAVAIAMRNRWRRKQLTEELRKEVTPRNVLLVGPTGCGKTEGACVFCNAELIHFKGSCILQFVCFLDSF